MAPSVLVCGDATCDGLLIQHSLPSTTSRSSLEANLHFLPGGAGLLYALLRKMDLQLTIDPGLELPSDLLPRTYSLCRAFSDGIWRIERFLGSTPGAPGQSARNSPSVTNCDLIIVDDLGLGFADTPALWPHALQEPAANTSVILQQSAPLSSGALWEHLMQTCPDRLVVVTSIEDLRSSQVQISRQLSWERTAQDILWEVTHNPRINGLSRAKCLVISLGAAGVVRLTQRQNGKPEGRLFFDPLLMEDEWERTMDGTLRGASECLTAAVALTLQEPDGPHPAAGVAAIRTLYQHGLGPSSSPPNYPIAQLAANLLSANLTLASADIQDPLRNLEAAHDGKDMRIMPGFWTILEDRYPGALENAAQQIVLQGVAVSLQGVPFGKFGALVTVDRREIEALRSMRALIDEYCRRPASRPLSIAVFGPPGAGKSFAVKQIARSARPGEIETLTFNLSQFRDPHELLDALHRVRDVGLSGKIPLVFWDEFDSAYEDRPLGWLRYFLAPMQDGEFQQGQIVHPIGRAIFVFAGGTSHQMAGFGSQLSEAQQRAVKLPDFTSRLKGYLNVLGPDPVEEHADPYFILRRAIILRVLIEIQLPQLIDAASRRARIDPGVLRALLTIPRYRHGVRSIESILAMSQLADCDSFQRSSLPAEDQLNLHVDGMRFLSILQQLELSDVLLERLAEAAHDVFCDALEGDGYIFGETTDAEQRTHQALKPYAELASWRKESNRDLVRKIPERLLQAGYLMIPARSNEPPFEFPGDDLESLAVAEHQRWMREKQRAGWRHGDATDAERRIHASLVDWELLPEEEREKDRRMIRAIPHILARVGYAVLKN